MPRSKKRLTRKRRQSKKRRFSRRRVYKHRGGFNLPVPEGSVVGVDLDPKDDYSVPILVSKNKYENEILED